MAVSGGLLARNEGRLTKQLKFIKLRHARVREGTGERAWQRSGPSYKDGNYTLKYTAFDGRPIYLANFPLYQLQLEIVDKTHRIPVTHVRSGRHIGEGCLIKFLDHINHLNMWAQKVDCRLVVLRNGVEVSVSNTVKVTTPVKPWTQPLDPQLFAADPTIRYCGDLEKKQFYGRLLKEIAGKLYFTYVGALETKPKLRGFACIGFAGNMYLVNQNLEPRPYGSGENMVIALNGSAFDWSSRPRSNKVRFKTMDIDSDDDAFDREDAYVRVGKRLFLKFLETPEAKSGSYLIWIPGHVGLIRDGILYECKPSGKGFTYEKFDESRESAVRKFSATDLESQLKVRRLFLSKLP